MLGSGIGVELYKYGELEALAQGEVLRRAQGEHIHGKAAGIVILGRGTDDLIAVIVDIFI